MKRDILELANQEFDLLIVGGGIYGATAVWDAVLRGLKVALIEKGDFGGSTSSNSLKIIHGGLRYLQHGDLIRVRESVTERRIMMNIAPHLIQPLPCVMPTKGHAMKGPEVMRVGLMANDVFSFDRNKNVDKEKHLPTGKIVSKDKLFELTPFIDRERVNGGALWYDAHMTNSERLLLSFIRSAEEKGAVLANYVKAENFLIENDKVLGVNAVDELSGETFKIRAKMTLTTAGPWINNLLSTICSQYKKRKFQFSTAMNLIVDRQLSEAFAFGAPSKKEFKDKDALINKGSRLLFMVPWRGKTIVGTEHKPYHGDPDDFHPTEEEIQTFLDEVNTAVPTAHLKREDVIHVLSGLLPMSAFNKETGDVTIEKHFQVIDHKEADKLDGLLSVLTVKYTTARGVAQVAVDKAVKKLGIKTKASTSDKMKIWGGQINDYAVFIQNGLASMNHGLDPDVKHHLMNTFGSKYIDILQVGEQDRSLLQRVSKDTPVIKAEVVYGVREEMAQHLADVVLRRTELGSAGQPSDAELETVAELMATELGWSDAEKKKEIENTKKIYQPVK